MTYFDLNIKWLESKKKKEWLQKEILKSFNKMNIESN